uniref:Signal peptidase I n=1 Tax=uncultured bacterium contig00030 TaxID=1181519 RepID=A0A806K068_9BACT|nr:signal peptidase I [uncultured bacterium contig00030]
MFDKWMQYSYAAQKHQRHRLLKIIFTFIIFILMYNILVSFFISVWVLENDTMQPSFNKGDRLIFTSFMMPVSIFRNKIDEKSLSVRRGSIVLVDKGDKRNKSIPLRVIDGIVRFFTLQKASIFSSEGQYYIKRVIALPGDEIFMENYVFRVKPAGSLYSLTEFELSEKPYNLAIPGTPSLWDEEVPFSGNMDTIILGPDQCFVVSDDRGNTNDSRTWGPVPPSSITARAILRFWPVMKFNLL